MTGKSKTITTRFVCAILFVAFSFLWLFFFQGDLLAVAQHVLSGGVTSYDRTVGATIVTVTLMLLQMGVYAITRLSRRTHALTYVPSFLLLTFISDISSDTGNTVEVGRLWWLLVAVFVMWIGAVWLAKQMLPVGGYDKQPTGLFSFRTWVNVLQMAAMMLFTAAVANTNAVLHYRAHAETALMHGDSREAMRTGWESLETDRHLTMLRAYALSREGILGERLFCYPLAGRGIDLLPMLHEPLLLPADSIWRHLGARPAFPMRTATYYSLLETDSLATSAVADYVLCGALMDRDLKTFLHHLPRYYGTADTDSCASAGKYSFDGSSLPRHYREALVLCSHLYPGTVDDYRDEPLEQEWQLMEQMKAQCQYGSDQRLQMLETFRRTYWYYFFLPKLNNLIKR